MKPSLEGVRHKKSDDALINKKSNSLLRNSPKINSKNVQVTTSSFRKAAAAEQVVLDFGDDYGFWENYQSLEVKDDYGFWENYLCLEEEVASRAWTKWKL
ncbi:hypothetical protein R3W88_001895 [Solanum pinnatisectum]|uniref:Uncharacterized protein n=1 Tax=Solanum pinnatisectum TaxID=50273 RepID=A0AAV9MK43_9SOLN|nr:hypothetical protein R3W88_001895 [Solanum pinnatisectum]